MRWREVREWQAFGRRGLVASEVCFKVAGALTRPERLGNALTPVSLTLIERQGSRAATNLQGQHNNPGLDFPAAVHVGFVS